MRHGLKLLIDGQPDMEVVAEAGDGEAAVQRALELKPDVVVMDISMPGMNGLAATRALKQAQPDAVDRHADAACRRRLLAGAAASGRVGLRAQTQSAPTELLQAIRGGRGRRAVPGFDADRASDRGIPRQATRRRQGQPASSLTDREAEVLRLIASGYGNKEIAARWRSAPRPSKPTRRTPCESST